MNANDSLFITAEMSCNHKGDFSNALKLILQAKSAGASAIKIQTFEPRQMVLDKSYVIGKGSKWEGENLYNLYRQAQTTKKWIPRLFEYAREEVDIPIFSSVFDRGDVDFLENLGCPIYKISSFECTDLELIRYASSTGKPLIISTGMVTSDQEDMAIHAAICAGCKDLSILFCISNYPATSVYGMKYKMDKYRRLKIKYGFSDHTIGNACAISAVAMGATVIEKHLKLYKEGGSFDDSFSIDMVGFESLVSECRTAFECTQPIPYEVFDEQRNDKLKRSFYYKNDLKAGDVIKKKDLKTARIARGICPSREDFVLNKKLLRDVFENDPVTMDDLYEKT